MTRRESILAFLLSPLAWARPKLTAGGSLIGDRMLAFENAGDKYVTLVANCDGSLVTYGSLNLAGPGHVTGYCKATIAS